MIVYVLVCFFFFQAEDGIRDLTVTGVQTCALPIYVWGPRRPGEHDRATRLRGATAPSVAHGRARPSPRPGACVDRPATGQAACRSEEHTSELQSQSNLVCRLLLEKKK